MTMFTSDETERYARHILLKEIGGPGQQRLKAATVALVVWHQTRYKHLALAFQILGLVVTFPYLCTWSGGV